MLKTTQAKQSTPIRDVARSLIQNRKASEGVECLHCGEIFKPAHGSQLTCNPECYKASFGSSEAPKCETPGQGKLSNYQRGERAYRASLSWYEGDTEERITDLLTDLMHLAPDYGNFDEMLETARMHFDAETETFGHCDSCGKTCDGSGQCECGGPIAIEDQKPEAVTV